MKIEQKIGVVGNGFVGGAVKFGFSPSVGCDAEVRVYDKNPNKSTHTLEETVNESDFILRTQNYFQIIFQLIQFHQH